MKKLLLISFVLIFCQFTVRSQSCLPAGITFTTQAEIDSFQTNNPNCTEIEGDVEINGDDITNLNGLSVLTSLGGSLKIRSNDALTSLSGLDNLASIAGYLRIELNNSLTSILELGKLTSIGGNLVISNNGSLTALTGLHNVTSIGGDLRIGGTDTMTDLTGLDNLTSIGGMLFISSNPMLISLSGIDNLTSIGGNLDIYWNSSLTSLTGLDSINAASITNLSITDNSSLSTCEVQSVCNYLNSPNGTIVIHDNAPGCNSQEEVQDSCEANAVNINEQFIQDNLVLYPNPATQEVNISTDDGKEIDEVTIYTLTGQHVLQDRPANSTINISALQPGMYIVEVTIENRKIRQKLLVE